MRPARTVLAAGAVLVLGGCSFSFYSGTSVPAADIEQEITNFMDGSGREVSVDCPADLDGEQGHSVRCTMVEGPDERTVEVTVDAVQDNTVSYSFTVLPAAGADDAAASATGAPGTDEVQVTGNGTAEGTGQTAAPGDDAAQTGAADDSAATGGLAEPVFLPAAGVEETIAAEVSSQTGHETLVSCPEDLPGVAGAGMTCELDGAAGPGTVEVVVDSVTDTDVHYSFEVVG